jgi:hypothetical protein
MRLPAVLLGSLLLASDALGCSVVVTQPLKFAFQDSKLFFVGKVRAVGPWSVTFEVIEQFAGEPAAEVKLKTSNSCSMSGFVQDATYLVEATESGEGLIAYNGSHTHRLTSAEDRELQLVRRRGRQTRASCPSHPGPSLDARDDRGSRTAVTCTSA